MKSRLPSGAHLWMIVDVKSSMRGAVIVVPWSHALSPSTFTTDMRAMFVSKFKPKDAVWKTGAPWGKANEARPTSGPETWSVTSNPFSAALRQSHSAEPDSSCPPLFSCPPDAPLACPFCPVCYLDAPPFWPHPVAPLTCLFCSSCPLLMRRRSAHRSRSLVIANEHVPEVHHAWSQVLRFARWEKHPSKEHPFIKLTHTIEMDFISSMVSFLRNSDLAKRTLVSRRDAKLASSKAQKIACSG